MKRYPLDALVDALGLSEAGVARLVGLSGSTLKRARENGFVEEAADRYAVRAGLLPWLVWSDWLDDLEVECAERSCTNRFVPSRGSHRFCSKRCKQRVAKRNYVRRRYQSDAEFRDREKRRTQAYREEARPAIRAKNRRYREANRQTIRERQKARRAQARAA